MSAVWQRPAPAVHLPPHQHLASTKPALAPSVLTVAQYFQQPPAAEPLLAIAAGPFPVNLHAVHCVACGQENLLRQYAVKTLALVRGTEPLDAARQRAQLAAMDSLALAGEFMASPLWITADQPPQFIGLGMLYMPFARWVVESNAIVASRIGPLACEGESIPPVAALAPGDDANGRKCLMARCRQCQSMLLPPERLGLMRFSFALMDANGNKAMLPWALAVGTLSNIDFGGRQAGHDHGNGNGHGMGMTQEGVTPI